MKKITLFSAFFLLNLSVFTATAQETRFLQSLPNIPLAPHTLEIPEQTLIFDTPAGAITEVTLSTQTPDTAHRYYEQILSSLGWQKQSKNNYIQGDLQLEIQQDTNLLILSLSPRENF